MANLDRYPSVTSFEAVWRVASFQGQAGPLVVLTDPARLRPEIFAPDPLRRLQAVLSAAREGRFAPRGFVDATGKDTDIQPVLITRDTLPHLRESLLDVQARNVESVQRFLERWGLLVLREGFALERPDFGAGFGTDDVAATRAWIGHLQTFFRDPKEWLPKIWQTLKKAGPGAWPSGTFTLAWGPAGPEPRVSSVGLLDALLMALPLWAEELPPRRCANERCNNGHPRLIPAPRPGQAYCTELCATANRVRRFKRKKARVLRRLAQGDTIAAVAERRYRLDSNDVRKWRRAMKREHPKKGQKR